MEQLEVKFSEVSHLIRRCFPDAKSRRTVKISKRNTYQVSDYWSEGSRNECRFLDLETLQVKSSESVPTEQRQQAANPFGLAIYTVTLAPGFAVVEHCIFRGKSLGYRIFLHDERMQQVSANLRNLTGPIALLSEGNENSESTESPVLEGEIVENYDNLFTAIGE
jgi:hypothetical protein